MAFRGIFKAQEEHVPRAIRVRWEACCTSAAVTLRPNFADASTVRGNQALAHRILEETEQLHILVNNVGGLYNDRWETDDGYE